jgi:hypothetical protein
MEAAGVSDVTDALPTDLDEVALHATIRMK